MKAMLFAAGLGTRLRPLTNDRPKALVEIGGKTLLEWNLRKLAAAGFTEIVVNVHYFADMVSDFIELRGGPDLKSDLMISEQLSELHRSSDPNLRASLAMDLANVSIYISDEREQLLETGGGLLKAKDWLTGGPFLVHNVDILSDVDLGQLMEHHKKEKNLATLCVRKRRTSRYLLFHEKTEQLVGWKNVKTGEERPARSYRPEDTKERAFSGIYVLDPAIFDFMPPIAGDKFSIIDTLLKAAKTEKIQAYSHDDSDWVDVGRPEAIPIAEVLVAKKD